MSDPPADPASPSPEPAAPELTPEQVAAAEARAVVPEKADGYSWTASDKLKGFVEIGDGDPMIQALQEHAAGAKWTQGQYQDVLGTLEVFAEKGLLEPLFDPAAEVAKLGDNGKAQMQEQETFLTSLKDRGEINDEEFGELMSLVPSAAGTKALAALRKIMGPAGQIQAPTAPAGGPDALKAEARQMRSDPRYETDREYRKQADAKFMEAWKNG